MAPAYEKSSRVADVNATEQLAPGIVRNLSAARTDAGVLVNGNKPYCTPLQRCCDTTISDKWLLSVRRETGTIRNSNNCILVGISRKNETEYECIPCAVGQAEDRHTSHSANNGRNVYVDIDSHQAGRAGSLAGSLGCGVLQRLL